MGGRSIAHLLGAVLLVFFTIFFTAPPSIMAQESPSIEFDDLPTAQQPTLISADEVVYDKKLDLVTARGNVEVSQGGRVVVADEVTYNLDTGTVSASGEVTLVEPSGNVVFADYIELSADLRDAFIRDIRILMTDNSRLAGASAERSEGRYVVLQKGVFSPCELCREDPESAPLWQIKANQVIHDQEDKTIQYYDAWMEIFGVPILYTPYFEHPDPTVKRKSGFLAPGFGASDTLGTTIQIPYFWAIDDTKDLTFEPLITTKQSIVLAGEYRQLFTKGFISIVGSGTIADREKDNGKTEEDALRGHIDAFARFDIDKHWRTGLDVQRTIDDTYLRFYDISAERTLTSRAFAERFEGRNYGAANAYLYQGLREKDNNNESPILAPLIDYNFVGEPGVVGGKYFADADLMVLSRIEGRDSRRVSLKGGYELPYTGPIGDVYSLVAQVQADGYWTDGVDPGNPNVNASDANGSDVTGRFFPQVGLTWRYPWVQSNESFQQVLEPIAQIVAAPTGGNPNEIPNEDSIGFEFDDTNLFNLNRFSGLDRVDSGTRVDYGLNWLGELGALGSSNLFAGQSYRITKPDQDIFTENSGVRDRLSDIVGRVQLNPIKELDLLYRFRLSKDDLRPLRHELSTKAGVPALKVNLSYIFIEGDENSQRFGDREEITGKIKSRLTKNWSASFGHKRDLERDEPLSTLISLSYENDCFLIEGVGQRKFFDDRELEPEDSIFIRFVFKYLGEFETR